MGDKVKTWLTYILKMNDSSFYTGATNDLKNRVNTHARGKGSKYVRSRLPIKEIYVGEMLTKLDALKLEREIKKLKKEDKIERLFKGLMSSSQ